MATKFKPNKKGVITGTKNADKITWAKGWTKTITVNANGGGDTINFNNSKYKNKLYGQDGSDTIYGGTKNDTINGGKGNDKIYAQAGDDKIYAGVGKDYINAGKGTNYIYLNKNEGNNTIVKGGGSDTIVFAQESNFNNFKFYYSGNDLIFTANGTSAILKDFAKGGHSAKYIQAGSQKYKLGGKTSGKITGSNGKDLLVSTGGKDTINGGSGNDIIKGGKGNDVINAGAGTNSIYYSLGDGNDTIQYGGGTDTLVFDKGITVSATYSGNDLKVKYSGGSQSNTITISNFKNKKSVKYITVGGTKKSVDSYIKGGDSGADKIYEVNDTHLYDDPEHPLTLTSGQNNKVVFSGQYDDCYITSNNASAYTDTLQISDIKMTNGYNISNLEYLYNDTTLTIDTYWQNQETDEQGGGYIMYTATNTPKIAIADSERTYNFSGYTSVQGTNLNPLELADGNNLVYIKAQTGTSYITSNDDYNVIKTEYGEHGSGLNYLYGGGHDLICTSSSSNDVYTATIDGDTSVVIYDADGTDIINANGDNVRVIFDAGKTTTFKTQGIFIDKTVLSNMSDAEFKNIFSTDKGMNIAEMNIDDGDTLNVNGSAITFDNWSIDTNNVHQAVAGWLTDNSGYTSVADALEKCTDDALLTSLKNCFVNGTYQTPSAPPVWHPIVD